MFYFFYYFPLGLDVRPRRATWATWSLLAACAIAFVVQRALPALFWSNYSAFVFVPANPSPASLILNAYFHGGWLHLLSNMVSLAVFGPALEDRLGPRRFLVLYHVSNVLANIVQGAIVVGVLPAQANYGVLGASGAIAGLLGLFAVRLHFARLRVGWWAFLPLQAYTRCGTARLPVWVAIVLWFGMQLGMALLQREGAAAGVAVGSHLGGLLAGAALGLWLGLHVDAATDLRLHRGKAYLDRAAWFPAQGEFIEYVRRQPKDIHGHLGLARTYRLTGRHVLADQHYRIAGSLEAATKRLDRVQEIHGEALRGNPRFAFAPALQLHLAQVLERCMKPQAAAAAYVRLADWAPHCAEAPLALYRAACLTGRRAAGPPHATELLEQLVERYPETAEASLARAELRRLAASAAPAEDPLRDAA
jgi:membrane associated rhomboid family serine protease